MTKGEIMSHVYFTTNLVAILSHQIVFLWLQCRFLAAIWSTLTCLAHFTKQTSWNVPLSITRTSSLYEVYCTAQLSAACFYQLKRTTWMSGDKYSLSTNQIYLDHAQTHWLLSFSSKRTCMVSFSCSYTAIAPIPWGHTWRRSWMKNELETQVSCDCQSMWWDKSMCIVTYFIINTLTLIQCWRRFLVEVLFDATFHEHETCRTRTSLPVSIAIKFINSIYVDPCLQAHDRNCASTVTVQHYNRVICYTNKSIIKETLSS